jgi:DNA-directed RNA polymerase subunit RPC12/RpoP
MNSYDCPHCGKTAMGFAKKQLLGPGRSVACRSCGKRVSVPMWSLAVYVPIVLAVILPSQLGAAGVTWFVILAIAVAVVGFIQHAFIPLVPK